MKVMFAAIGSETISIEALTSVLKQKGYRCDLAFDRGMFDDKQYFSVNFLAKVFSDTRQVIKDIVCYNPDLLAFSVFADNFQWCLDIAKRIKEKINIPIIMGGVHPTSVPDVCINQDNVDIICLGEGEYPLLELVTSMDRGVLDYSIKNLWFKKDGQIIKNPIRPLIKNLDELPLLDKEIFKDFIPISKYYLTVTNKGCIATCSYCSQNVFARWEKENNIGPFYRERSVDSVIDELVVMKERYHIKRVDIKNNILSSSKEWTFEFCKKYKEKVGLPFRIMGHPKTITRETSLALKDAGCWHVQIGIESVNPVIRKEVLNRHETNDEIYQALFAMDDAGLNYSVDVMVGLPGEQDQDIINAIKLFSKRRHLIRASIFWLEYLPGVGITDYAYRNNYITKKGLERIDLGLQKNYLSTGSIRERKTKEHLLSFQMLFRLLPIMPEFLVRYFLNKRRFRFFTYLPQVFFIIIIDIIVSVLRRDHWAMYAMYSYAWEIKRRIKRVFFSRRLI